jgi:hypothetical protein
MNNDHKMLHGLLALLATLFLATGARAELFRAYLDSSGSDANGCTLQAPCRLLPAALAAVANGGEIWLLDSANFNVATVNITKSVTILAIPGAVGSVVALGGPAINVSTPGLNVALRNLVIVPFPASGATYGVDLNAASTLTIEGSLIANIPNNAVHVGGAGKLEITNSIIRNNFGFGVYLQNGASANIASTKLLNNTSGGIFAEAASASTVIATVSDSIISGGHAGVYSWGNVTGSDSRIFLTRTTIQNTDYGLNSETSGAGSSLITVSSSMITNNGYGWFKSGVGANIRTLGNNHIADNGNNAGALTNAPLQ